MIAALYYFHLIIYISHRLCTGMWLPILSSLTLWLILTYSFTCTHTPKNTYSKSPSVLMQILYALVSFIYQHHRGWSRIQPATFQHLLLRLAEASSGNLVRYLNTPSSVAALWSWKCVRMFPFQPVTALSPLTPRTVWVQLQPHNLSSSIWTWG